MSAFGFFTSGFSVSVLLGFIILGCVGSSVSCFLSTYRLSAYLFYNAGRV